METIDQTLFTYRRKLPHVLAGASTYHVTFRSKVPLPATARDAVVETIRFGEREHFNLFLGVVMPDHVHLLLFPRELTPGQWRTLPSVMKGLKGASARAVNLILERKGSLWQDESFDRLIRHRREFRNVWRYIARNPVNAGLVKSARDYPWLMYPSEDTLKHIL